ncbi:TetR/AcrR family transcriptional regulator [uncultured Clostridium sp.]|uniref:TetR/AcrR family transcriptional regulator n=1 Tax=uncultured Clostridium sp. TaxID=59620 RepID=UPI0026134636|nr:TetR/AcrR family transcriptional regulator [uncultured Clostridium sp.]
MENITKRNRKSIELICNAMFKLLKEKDFKSISITELCEEAQLARKTFYRNFESKEDVIKKSIDYMFKQLGKRIKFDKNMEPKKITLEYFNFWYENREFLKLILKNDLFNILNSQYDLYIKVFRKIMCGEEEMSRELEYTIIFASGGYWNVLQHWVRKDFKDDPKDLAKMWEKHFDKIRCKV